MNISGQHYMQNNYMEGTGSAIIINTAYHKHQEEEETPSK